MELTNQTIPKLLNNFCNEAFIIAIVPANHNLKDVLKELNINIKINTKNITKYDRYLLKTIKGNEIIYTCVSKNKYDKDQLIKKIKKTIDIYPITSIFIDYESWYYTLKKQFHEKPNLKSFFNNISYFGNFKDIIFFGNFAEEMKTELMKIRTYSNNIIECYSYEKKDFTDFIMVDYIYKYVVNNTDVQQYILLSNDGHFIPLLNYLKNNLKKIIITVGIENAYNTTLFNMSDYNYIIYSNYGEEVKQYWPKMLQRMYYVENKGKLLTFSGTVEANRMAGIDENVAYSALQKLIEAGYIDFDTVNYHNKNITVMYPNWPKLKEDNVFSVPKVNY